LNRTKNVFVTGNTVVDALKFVQGQPLSGTAADLIGMAQSKVPSSNRKIILLTAHRRENLGTPLKYIFQAVELLLRSRDDVLVIYPIHRPGERLLGGERSSFKG
jgi:UDP-N-acetylglucosamine 2-epimerase (non-hydrolysing)